MDDTVTVNIGTVGGNALFNDNETILLEVPQAIKNTTEVIYLSKQSTYDSSKVSRTIYSKLNLNH